MDNFTFTFTNTVLLACITSGRMITDGELDRMRDKTRQTRWNTLLRDTHINRFAAGPVYNASVKEASFLHSYLLL
jgi:hypothetical protein